MWEFCRLSICYTQLHIKSVIQVFIHRRSVSDYLEFSIIYHNFDPHSVIGCCSCCRCVYWAVVNIASIIIHGLLCLTDCSQPASEHNSPSLRPEHRDQEDGGERSTKDEDKCNFMDFPVRAVAEQLTRLDAVGFINKYLKAPFCVTMGLSFTSSCLPQELFVRAVPFHCLGCVWSQRDKKENRNLAPTVRATISQFNAVTNRVITSLLCPSSPSPSTSSPISSPSSSSAFLYPSSALSSPNCTHTSPAHRACVIERWIAIAQVRVHKHFQFTIKWHKWMLSEKHNRTAFFVIFCFLSAGVQTAEEFLLSAGHPLSPAVQRCVSPQEDLGCCQQVSHHAVVFLI